jgi:hypothetical protein
MSKRSALSLFLALAVGGCGQDLPAGYSINHGDRGKAWLQNPDGTITYPGLIKELYRDSQGHILLVAYAATYGGELARPAPIDRTCYVALLIDASKRSLKQITTAEAAKRSSDMEVVETHERPCLKGMPNT